MSSQAETINMNRVLYREWFPQIVYDHHQTGPPGTVMFAPPFRDPFNYFLDPLIPGLDRLDRGRDARALRRGREAGVTMRSGSNYSTWWNGGLRTTAYFHNQIGLLTETIGSPTPIEIPFVPERQLPSADLPHPIAPQRWRFRQSIDYSMTANRAVLDAASRNRETLLFNMYRMGQELHRARQPRLLDGVAARSRGAVRADAGLRTAVPRSRASRRQGVHPARRPAGLPDRDEVRRCAAQDGDRRASRDGGVHASAAGAIRPARSS